MTNDKLICKLICWALILQEYEFKVIHYHNPSLGFATKAKAYKVVGQEGSPGVTSRALGSAKECEGMNLHIPK
jgi:hypothetical protein